MIARTPLSRIDVLAAGGLFALTSVLLACASRGVPTDAAPAAPASRAGSPPASTPRPDEPSVIDLSVLLPGGAIDADGPVVDLGENQSARYVQPPLPEPEEPLRGETWVTVRPRLRLRVPVDPTVPPAFLQVRVRRCRTRTLLALLDGIPLRRVAVPAPAAATVLKVAIPPERIRRESVDVDLRFLGLPIPPPSTLPQAPPLPPRPPPVSTAGPSRANRQTARRPRAPRAPVDPSRLPSCQVDWVHLTRHAESLPALRSELVADVRVRSGPPRRSIVAYPPTRLESLLTVPARAVLRGALAAEGVRGGDVGEVTMRVRVETDGMGVGAATHEETLRTQDPWREITLDLQPFAGRTARVSFEVVERTPYVRGVFAEPRIELPAAPVVGWNTPVQRALLVIVRGLGYDRIQPSLPPMLATGGFARLARESLLFRALAASPRPLAAVASLVTGLPAERHGMAELTDVLDDAAPTLFSELQAQGVRVEGFTDDRWWRESGLDRGMADLHGCPNDAVLCRADAVIPQAVSWLSQQTDRRALAVVLTRAGLPPFDPPLDLLELLDQRAGESGLTPEQTATLAQRSRRVAIALGDREIARLTELYDAALAGVDRALAAALDRLPTDVAVVLTSDRGTSLGERGRVGDDHLQNPFSAYVPILLRAPGVSPRVSGTTVSTMDVAPTLRALFVADSARAPTAPSADPAPDEGVALLPVRDRIHPRGILTMVGLRAEPGLRLGDALGWPSGGRFVLLHDGVDPSTLIAGSEPIGESYAASVLSELRERAARDPSAAAYVPSTRSLEPQVEQALRTIGWLRR